MPGDVEFKVYGHCDARVIDAFGPILRRAREDGDGRFWDGALFGYPLDTGALFIATEGHVLLAYQDRSARLTVPAQFMIPNGLIEACAPPQPLPMNSGGEPIEVDLPEWAQPSHVMLSSFGAAVYPKMPHPGAAEADDYPALAHWIAATGSTYREADYRARSPRFDWRAVFEMATGEGGLTTMSPELVGLVATADSVLNPTGVVAFRPTAPGAPIRILFSGCPDLFGVIMPQKLDIEPAVPAFATVAPAADLHEQQGASA